MRSRQVSLVAVIWIVIGMLVAANHHFLEHLDSLSRVLSAVLAVAVWPLVVLDVHFGI
jgi:ABC-type anion transport system duplicated permease subunit